MEGDPISSFAEGTDPALKDEDTYGMGLLVDGESSNRTGVEDRFVVLEQFRMRPATDIINLDSDDDDMGYTITEPIKYQSTPTNDFMPRTEVIEQRHIPSSLVNTPTRDTVIKAKKKLFPSDAARDSIMQKAGMLTPPYDISANSSFSVSRDQNREETSEEDEETIMKKLLEDYNTNYGPSNDMATTTSSEVNEAMKARNRSEADGVARSQQLRAQMKQRNESLKRRAAEVDEWEDDTPDMPADRARLLQSNRRSLTPVDQNNVDDQDVAWGLLDEAREDSSQTRSQQARRPPQSKFNPYSRAAAENLRTQSRHIEEDVSEDEETWYGKMRAKEDQHSRILASAYGLTEKQVQKRQRPDTANHSRPAKRPRFHAPDLNGTPGLKPAHKPSQPGLSTAEIRKLMGTEDTTVDPDNQEKVSVRFAALNSISQSRLPVVSAAAGTITEESVFPSQDSIEHITFPKNYAALSHARQEYTVKREIARERGRDLSAIQKCFMDFATFMSLSGSSLEGPASAEITELRVFAQRVLVEGRPGKPLRKRIGDISGNLKRRIDRLKLTPGARLDDASVSVQLDVILSNPWLRLLKQEIPKAQAQAAQYASESNRLTNEHHSKKHTASSGTAHKSKNAERLTELQRAVKRFDTSKPRNYSSQEDSALHIVDPENDGAISDEDDELGPVFTRPEKASYGIEVEEEVEMPFKKPVFRQGRDSSLLEQMVIRNSQQEHAQRQGAQRADNDMVEEQRARAAQRAEKQANEATAETPSTSQEDTIDDPEYNDSVMEEFDDLTSEEGISLDANGRALCSQYEIRMQTSGFGDIDAHEHIQGRFLDQEKAVEAAHQHLMGFLARRGLNPMIAKDSSFDRTHEIYRERIRFADDREASVYIVEELVAPSDEALDYAKVQAACRPPQIWLVDWQKTFEPVTENDKDSLFGDEAETAAAAGDTKSKPSTITENETIRNVRAFLNLRLANQYALEEYQRWYMDHSREDESLLANLKEIGEAFKNLPEGQCWGQENSFEVKKDGMGKAVEYFRIEVVKANSFGPSN